uniref:Enhancer of polycomb homolog n=1 Tax=Oncorhynchus tshawytscha TaxID=74940 RepID=A0AAZ3Q8M0_ONCTS
MSKLSFRARALDASKPLPVFRCEDLPDLHEYASINRAVPQMPTGMEKEEESEHHLQRAMSAQSVYGEKHNMVIPVPEADGNIAYYESLYPGEFKMPKQLIHIQPFTLDTEQPDYDLDTEDEVFVNKLKKKLEITFLQFEEMVDRLEKGSGQQAVSLQEAKLLLKEDDELIKEVFDYWTRKRKNGKHGTLHPTVKQEKRDGSSTSDPYVAFRRRTEKMQTRKNRKNEEAGYEKMLKLRRDLSRAVTILEMIKRREKSKRELLHLTLEIVEKRNVMSDFGGEIMAEVLAQRALAKPAHIIPLAPLTNSNQYRHQDHMDLKEYKSKPEKTEVVRQKRKYERKPKVLPLSAAAPHYSGPSVFNAKDVHQYDFPSSDDELHSQMHSGSSEAEEENDPDGSFSFRRKAGCQYYSRLDHCGSWPWVSPSEGGLGDTRYRYCLTTLTVPPRCLGMARRRLGRGGRVLLDRAHTDFDNVFHGLDSEMLDLPAHSPVTDKFASTSQTNTSDRTSSYSSSSADLSRLLLNIKSSRWRHFRPRTLSLHDEDNTITDPLFRRLGRGQSRITATLAGTTGPLRGAGHTAPTAVLVVLLFQVLVSKMLDSASAQFAATALVTTDQLLALKTKDEEGLGCGVNGVLSPSGVYKGLNLTSTASLSPAAPTSTPSPLTTTTPSSPFLLPSTFNNGTPHTNAAKSTATQVLMGNNNNLRLSMSSLGGPAGGALTKRHIPRTLSHAHVAVSSSALKLAANCQMPKVSTNTPSMDIVPRENQDQDKPALNSISDNTVAMEVT